MAIIKPPSLPNSQGIFYSNKQKYQKFWRVNLPTDLFHGNLPDLSRMLADVFEEVLEFGHGGLLDALPQLGDGVAHDLGEPVLADPGKIGMFQLLQSFQGWVVPGSFC